MKRSLVILCVLAVAILPYLPSLRAGFVFDDHEVVERHPGVLSATPALAWSLPYWPDRPAAGLYRPWTTTSFWVDRKLHGLKPGAFHAMNLLLHAAASLAALLLLRRFFPTQEGAARWTALLFAAHPIHTEAVVGVVGRSELWAALGMLLAYERGLAFAASGRSSRLVLSVLAAAIALFSKESAVGLLLLPLLHARGPWPGPGVTIQRRWLWVAGGWALPLLLLLLARVRVLGDLQGLDGPGLMDNALARAPLPARVSAALGFQWLTIWKLVAPYHLSADYSYPSLLPSAGWQIAGAAFALLAILLVVHLVKRRDAELLFGAALSGAATLLTANLLLPIGTIYAERLLYLPALGGLFWLVILVHRLPARTGIARPLILGLFLAAFAGRTIARIPDWRDDAALFAATVRDAPRSGKAHANLAVTLLREERLAEAQREAEAALALAPGYTPAEGALGSALLRQGRAEESLAPLRAAAYASPRSSRNLESAVELGNAYLTLRRGSEAESVFLYVRELSPPGDARHLIGAAGALATQSRWPESARAWQNAVAASPGDAAVARQWAYALWQAGRPDSAEQIYRGLMEVHPDDAEVENELAWMLARTGRSLDEALRIAARAFDRRPGPDTGDTMLEAYAAADRRPEAVAWIGALRSDPERQALADSLELYWQRRNVRKDEP